MPLTAEEAPPEDCGSARGERRLALGLLQFPVRVLLAAITVMTLLAITSV